MIQTINFRNQHTLGFQCIFTRSIDRRSKPCHFVHVPVSGSRPSPLFQTGCSNHLEIFCQRRAPLSLNQSLSQWCACRWCHSSHVLFHTRGFVQRPSKTSWENGCYNRYTHMLLPIKISVFDKTNSWASILKIIFFQLLLAMILTIQV